MKSAMNIIYMADVVNSHETLTPKRYEKFKDVVNTMNAMFADSLASPLTITLGDEFQGIIKSNEKGTTITDALHIIFEIEEQLWLEQTGITLRHVLYEGIIESPINPDIAHGMIGEGLTKAREALSDIKKGRSLRSKRFAIKLEDSDLSQSLERCFLLYESITGRWNSKDVELIEAFLQNDDYKQVAEHLHKDSSLMWRRQGWLWMREYKELKLLMKDMVEMVYER